MKLLLLAFEPVGSLRFDLSGRVAEAAVERLSRSGVPAEAVLIPAAFSRCWAAVEKVLMKVRPQVVLVLAQRGNCRGIAFEKFGKNRIDAEIPDREGAQPRGIAVVAGGKPCYETTLPIERMAEKIRRKGIPAGISQDAGAFVCNALYYQLLRAAEERDFGAGFVHLPHLPGQNLRCPVEGMAFGDMVEGIEAAVSVLAESGEKAGKAEKAP